MKEWLKVTRGHNGVLVVTVVLSTDNLTARWSTKTYRGQVKGAVVEARKYANELIEELRDT